MSNDDRSGPLAGRVALITGGTSGIGAAAALQFAAAGAAVVFNGRRLARGRELAQQIEREGGTALFVPGDVCEESTIICAVQETLSRFGRLDYAFNNAGIGGAVARLVDQTEAAWDGIFDINVKAVWRCMKHEVPAMIATGRAAIVNNASIFGLVGIGVGVSPYVASKHAVVGLTKAAALEYATAGIRVNAVCPGFTLSEMLPSDPAAYQRLSTTVEANVPMKRIAAAQEVARVVLWLCSPDSAFITGQAIAVDGGWTVR
jgi:A-factor type gamma-butyrolactone 1'-reductase (1S-forming)